MIFDKLLHSLRDRFKTIATTVSVVYLNSETTYDGRLTDQQERQLELVREYLKKQAGGADAEIMFYRESSPDARVAQVASLAAERGERGESSHSMLIGGYKALTALTVEGRASRGPNDLGVGILDQRLPHVVIVCDRASAARVLPEALAAPATGQIELMRAVVLTGRQGRARVRSLCPEPFPTLQS